MDCYFPKEERKGTKNLTFNNFHHEGELDLKDFSNLESLTIMNSNKITNVKNIGKCLQLKKLTLLMRYGNLVNLDLSKNLKLTKISIHSGGKLIADLAMFAKMTELEYLDIGGVGYKDPANKFYGSLSSLKDCKKLKFLDVSFNQGINKGLEDLPIHLFRKERFYGTGILEQLEPFEYDINVWHMVSKKG